MDPVVQTWPPIINVKRRITIVGMNLGSTAPLINELQIRKLCFRFVSKFLIGEALSGQLQRCKKCKNNLKLLEECRSKVLTILWLKMKHRLIFMFPNTRPRSGDYRMNLQPANCNVDASSYSPCCGTGKESSKNHHLKKGWMDVYNSTCTIPHCWTFLARNGKNLRVFLFSYL